MREKSNKREADIRMSNEVHSILKDTFYDIYTTNFENVEDMGRQVKGVDVIFDYNGYKYYCDEKAAVRWRNLKTYTLELGFIDKGGHFVEGWLTREDLLTNSYLFVWVEEDCIEYALIRKQRIMDMLESLGWTKEKLRRKAQKIHDNPNEPLGNLYENKCCFKYSNKGNYVEMPINVQMSKDTYLSISDFHKVVKTEQFKGRKDEI